MGIGCIGALPFMKATYGSMGCCPLISLPPELLEHIYMYCTSGCVSKREMRELYVLSVLVGVNDISSEDIVRYALQHRMGGTCYPTSPLVHSEYD